MHIIKSLTSSKVLHTHSEKQFSLKDFFLSIISDCGFKVGTRASIMEEKIKSEVNSVNTDEFEKHKIKLLNKFVASLCVLAIFSGIMVLYSEGYKSAVIPLCFIPIFLFSSYLAYTNKVKLAFAYFVLSKFSIITFFIFIVNENFGINYYYLTTPIIAYIFLEDIPVLRKVIIVFSIILFIVSQYVHLNYEPLIVGKNPFIIRIQNFLSCFIIVYVLLRFYLKELKTYRKKSNDILCELNAKNANLKSFNRIAAHDLKEPLHSIAGFASLVEKRLAKKDCVGDLEVEALLHIKDASSRMKNLLDDLMAYSLSETSTGTHKKVELNEILTDVQKNLNDAIERSNATVKVSNLPAIYANRNFTAQLFQNLIANAIKFQPKGKNIENKQNPSIEITSTKRGEYEYIYVKDNGIGISKDKLQTIFEPYKRLNVKYSGTGLGLATCKNIVKQFDGKISVDSEMNVGTTFTLSFPSIH